MGAIGEPQRKIEYWPLETPVPARRSAPAAPPATTPAPAPAKEPAWRNRHP